MAYGAVHTSELPTVGSTTGPEYASMINAALQEIRATLANKVSPSGMTMDADLSFLVGGDYYALTDVGHLNLENKAAVLAAAGFPTALFTANGELYYNDNDGRQIQITTNGILNVSTTGGITGTGYGTGGVEVNWDSGSAAYRLRDGTGTDDFAHVHVDDVMMSDGSSHTLRLAAPSMSANYTLTFPSAVPASTRPVLMDNAGTLSTSNTLTLATLTTTGAVAVGAGLTCTGLITATAGLTAAANQHVTISGTGRFKHGSFVMLIPASAASCNNSANYSVSDSGWVGDNTIHFPLPMIIGHRVTSIDVHKNLTSATTAMRVYSANASGRVSESGPHTLNSGTAVDTVNVTDTTLASGSTYYVQVDTANAADIVVGIAVTYDLP